MIAFNILLIQGENKLRIKEIYTYKRPKIPFLSEVAPGEEMSFKVRIFCTREEMNLLSKIIPGLDLNEFKS